MPIMTPAMSGRGVGEGRRRRRYTEGSQVCRVALLCRTAIETVQVATLGITNKLPKLLYYITDVH